MSSQMQQLQSREVQKYYNDKSFWEKAAELVKKAAKELLEKALWLYYAAESPDTPAKAKYIVYGALGYLIMPIDAIPDLIPVVGYTDDLGVISVALILIAFHITPEVKKQAAQKINDLFGQN